MTFRKVLAVQKCSLDWGIRTGLMKRNRDSSDNCGTNTNGFKME